MCGVMVPFQMGKVGSRIVRIEDDITKAACAVIAWPFVRETLLLVLREVCRNGFRDDLRACHVAFFMYCMFTSMVGRFLLVSIKSPLILVVASLLAGLLEIFSRVTVGLRDWAYVRCITACWRTSSKKRNDPPCLDTEERSTMEEARKKDATSRRRAASSRDQAWDWYLAPGLIENRMQFLITEVIVEYVAIIVAPALKVACGYLTRRMADLGYMKNELPDLIMIAVAVSTQFLIKLYVDGVCCRVEESGLAKPVGAAWETFRKGNFWTVSTWLVMVGVATVALNYFVDGFSVVICEQRWSRETDAALDSYVCSAECLEEMNYSYYDSLCKGEWRP